MLSQIPYIPYKSHNSVCFKRFSRVMTDAEIKVFHGEVVKTVNNIAQELDIPHTPKIVLQPKVIIGRNEVSGVYRFYFNQIELSTQILTNPEIFKIYAKGFPLLNKQDTLAFIDKKDAEALRRKYNNIVITPLTIEDRKKITLKRAAHETLHAQQYDLMRRTEGIGSKKIKDETLGKKSLNYRFANTIWGTNIWKKFKKEEGQIKADSVEGQRAKKLFKSLKDYSTKDLDSHKYYDNLIEKEAIAYEKKFVEKTFGEWN
jgi:hypothetical protein